MKKDEIDIEREKKQSTFKSANTPESSPPPSEDAPEQDVAPEFEGEALTTEGETQKRIVKPKKRKIRWGLKRRKN